MKDQTSQYPINWFEKSFAAFEANAASRAHLPLEPNRKAAAKFVGVQGLPSPRNEDWKYTNISELARGEFVLSDPSKESQVTIEQIAEFFPADMQGIRVVFVDGRYSNRLSNTAKIENGISCEAFSTLENGALESKIQQSLEAHLDKYANSAGDSFAALNTALNQDGIFIKVERNVTFENPIQLLFLSTGVQRNATAFPRVLIVAGENSNSSVIETFASLGSESYFTNAICEVVVEQGATVHHTKIQRESDQAYHVSRTHVELARASRYHSHLFHFGGKLVRNEIHPVVNGEGVECYLNGLSALSGSQHVDNHTVIDHALPNSFSREIYKGVYSDKSAGVFNGTIIVRKDAQKTNAIQSNKSLLLSDSATIDTKPQLKIWADDVKCTHGATIGQLDDHALFYLRSRGIDRSTARNMLVHAFASEVIYNITDDSIREHLEALLFNKLGAHLA